MQLCKGFSSIFPVDIKSHYNYSIFKFANINGHPETLPEKAKKRVQINNNHGYYLCNHHKSVNWSNDLDSVLMKRWVFKDKMGCKASWCNKISTPWTKNAFRFFWRGSNGWTFWGGNWIPLTPLPSFGRQMLEKFWKVCKQVFHAFSISLSVWCLWGLTGNKNQNHQK